MVKPLTKSYFRNIMLPTNTLKLTLYFSTGRHFIRREYVRYDTDSFIADVGGYLGLLLGHSLLSLFADTWQYCAAGDKLR